MSRPAPGVLRRLAARAAPVLLILPLLALAALAGAARPLAAQHVLSVPFPNGFIGTRSQSGASNVLTYATLGIARTFFIQNSPDTLYVAGAQGNDVPGTLRIVRTDGTTLDLPAVVNWRMTANGRPYLMGILPANPHPVTFAYGNGQSIQITDGTVSTSSGTSIGGYLAGASLPQHHPAANNTSHSGNAAGVLGELNDYLATVKQSRPAGPVTVAALSTASATPTITGTATLAAGEQLAVTVNGVQYTTATSPAVARSGGAWSLALTAPLAAGTHDVSAVITNANGFTLSDGTLDELTVTAPSSVTTVTLGGTLTAAGKVYDGTTTATGATGGLTLVGVQGGHQVTISAVTLAFQTAAAGANKTVAVTGVTLGGAQAAQYAVSLAGAPTATAAVTPRPLTLGGTFTASDKPYDGTAAAAIATHALTLQNAVGGDAVSLTGLAAAFATPAVGAGKLVTLTAASLAGAGAPNYTLSLTGAPTATAAITAPPGVVGAVTVAGSFTADDKPYDGTVAATGTTTNLALAGVQAGHQVTIAAVTLAFQTPAAGTGKPVAVTAVTLGGPHAGLYTVDLTGAPTATASILPAAPPSAPIAVAAAPGDRALAVSWSPPAAAGCSAVTGYVADVSADGGTTWTRTGLTAPGAVPSLVNNLGYLVRVAAVNPCGTGPWAPAAGPVVPVAPTRTAAGQLAPAAPGTATVAANGVAAPLAVEVVQDTVLRMTGGAGAHAFALRLRAVDQPGAAIPLDTTRTLLLEHGGRAAADGQGFTPGSVATVYLYAAGGTPLLLGTVPVAADGAFAGSLPVPDTLAAGAYTLQVNGVDRTGVLRAVGLGVEVAAPPPELALTATPSDRAPAVGDTITITLAVTNAGRGPAVNTVIPRAFTETGFVVIAAAPLDGSYDGRTKAWTIPHLAVGAQARLRFTAVVLPPEPAAAAAPNATANAAPNTPPAASALPTPRP